MSNYAGIKASINANVKENNNQEITGVILNSVLNEMVTALGDGYQFKGVATTSTNPGSPDARVFYVAMPGTYQYFGNQTVPAAMTGFFKWDTSWHLETISTGVADGSVTMPKLASSLASKIFAEGYKYMGVATTSTNPGTPTQDVFYLAGAGTFTNFGGLVGTASGINVLKYSTSSSQWTMDSLLLTDFAKVVIQMLVTAGGQYSILENDFPKVGKIIDSGVWKVVNRTDSILIPLTTGVTYSLTFSAGVGAYAVMANDSTTGSPAYAPGGDQVLTTQGQEAEVEGVTGEYLYVRADPVAGGRLFPVIVASSDDPLVVLRSQVENEPHEGSEGVVSSGGLYTILNAMQSSLGEIKDVLPMGASYPPGRSDVDPTGISFFNRTPGGTSSSTRCLSSTITIPVAATGMHLSVAEGYVGIIYFLRQNGTWDSSVADSGSFAQVAYCAYPSSYISGGVWLYLKKTSEDSITTAEAKDALVEVYFDVPDTFLLPVASKELAQKSISILFIGNSLTQDAVSYVPYLLKTLFPDIAFNFYMWYNAGYTLGQQYTDFVNDAACDIFSTAEDSVTWVNANNSVKMSQVLTTYKFDIVCLQEYFNYKATYTDADLVDFNNCLSYIRTNYSKPFKVATLFHAPLRSSAASVFSLTKAGNELILQKTIADTLIAPGIAIYRAMSTSLDSLGDQGHLSPDGTHAQEGLPCLMEAYVVLSWILRQLSVPKSFINCKVKMTTAIYNTLNVPGANLGTGVIEGTDAENELSQDVAIQADKEGRGMIFETFPDVGA